MSSRGMCARNAVFSHTEVVSESKMMRDMLRFTMETAVGGCGGWRCETAVAAMVAYARLCSARVGSVLHRQMESQVIKRIVMVGSRWCWVVDSGAVLLGNVIAGFHGGAVLLGNVIPDDQTQCNGGFQVVLAWRWRRCVFRKFIAGFHGGAVLSGNAIEGFHGAAVLLGNVIARGQTHCNGGLQVALGCRWCRGVIRECHCRFPWWCGVFRECSMH